MFLACLALTIFLALGSSANIFPLRSEQRAPQPARPVSPALGASPGLGCRGLLRVGGRFALGFLGGGSVGFGGPSFGAFILFFGFCFVGHKNSG